VTLKTSRGDFIEMAAGIAVMDDGYSWNLGGVGGI
jgi:hypothetical protein